MRHTRKPVFCSHPNEQRLLMSNQPTSRVNEVVTWSTRIPLCWLCWRTLSTTCWAAAFLSLLIDLHATSNGYINACTFRDNGIFSNSVITNINCKVCWTPILPYSPEQKSTNNCLHSHIWVQSTPIICSTVKRPETRQDWKKEKSTCQLINPSEHTLLKAQNLQMKLKSPSIIFKENCCLRKEKFNLRVSFANVN